MGRGEMKHRFLAVAVVVAVALPSTVQARDKAGPTRRHTEIHTWQPKEPSGEGAQEATPGGALRLDAWTQYLEQQSEQKLDEAIETLKELIAVASDDDPDKPDYYMRLARLYWDKAATFVAKAEDEKLDRAILEAMDAGDEQRLAALKAQREAYRRQQRQWEHEAIEVLKLVASRFANSPKIDEVLFRLGVLLVRVGQEEEGYRSFVKLIQRRPDSPYVADALVNIGEYYFNRNDFSTALSFYDKVVESYPQSTVYGFALYKGGWCHYNLGRYDVALDRFLRVLRYSENLAKNGAAVGRVSLANEAIRDIVRTYAIIGRPDRAVAFFRKVAPDQLDDLIEQLADRYVDQADYAGGVMLYRWLIDQHPESYRRVEFQRKIVDALYRKGDRSGALRETHRMVELYRNVAPTAPKDWLAEESKNVELELRVIATSWHKMGRKPFNRRILGAAAELYQAWLDLFPNDPHAADIQYNVAALWEDLEQWDKAARAFDAVVASNPKGKGAAEAAYHAIYAWYQLVNLNEGKIKSEVGEDTLEPMEIPYPAKGLIDACERYLAIVGDEGEFSWDAHYAAGKLYYNYNHFDQAIAHLKYNVQHNYDHPNAPDAARLLLSAFNLKHDFHALEYWALQLSKTPLASGELQALLQRIRDQAEFNRCFDFELTKRHERAAECFLDYLRRYPDTKLADRALFNAAVNFYKARLVEKALKAYADLYNRVPDSPLAPRALFAIAETYRQIALYSEAADYYEQFVDNHPHHKLVERALRLASAYRRGLGQHDKALADYRRYLRLFPRSDKAAAVFFDMGRIYEKKRDWRAMEKHFGAFLKRYGRGEHTPPDLVLGAYLKLGEALWHRGRARAADRHFSKVIDLVEAMPPDQVKKLTLGVDFVAEAWFMRGEVALSKAKHVKLRRRHMKKAFNKMVSLFTEAAKFFRVAVKLKRPHWAIAGLDREGVALETLADAIEHSPLPRGVRGEAAEIYRETLAEKAEALRVKAIDYYKEALRVARERRWFNEHAAHALERLKQLDYSFDFAKEDRARPGAVRIRPLPPAFVFPQALVQEAAAVEKPSPRAAKAASPNGTDGATTGGQTP